MASHRVQLTLVAVVVFASGQSIAQDQNNTGPSYEDTVQYLTTRLTGR
jgi:hypothetical protein